MALDINGYNTDFNAFVKFAQNSFVTNDKTAVARFEVGGAPLGGRLIVAANPQFDKVGKFRNQTQKDLNNEIRTAFRNAIIDMFGGPVLKVRRERPRIHECIGRFAHKSGVRE